MKIGFLFPGQGTQSVGMGKEIYDKYEKAKEVYDRVHQITGVDIAKISFEGPEDVLNQTKYTQLAILTMSLAILEILKENGIQAEMSAGLSLGEYSALIYSGALDFNEGVLLVKKRGEYMQDLLPKGEWKMMTVLGFTDEQAEEVCSKITKGFAVPANYNTVGQVVISGEKEAVEEAEQIAKDMGGRKIRVLNTAGPFHTKMLIDSSNALRKELDNVEIHEFKSQVVKNIDGKPYAQDDDVRDILANHIINPVRFTTTVETMLDNGIDTFIEIGPGKTLSGFVKRAKGDKEVKLLNINDVNSLENTIKEIREEN